LTTQEWKSIFEKAWTAGIPHIIFTGGEPTLREDLAELIGFTQEIGQVSGLLTDGLSLARPGYMDSLLKKGLDHMMVVLDPGDEKSWEGLRAALAGDIHVTVHVTLDLSSAPGWLALVTRLADFNVYSLSLSAVSAEIKEELLFASRNAAEKGINLVWDLPVPYSHLHPAAMENEDGEALANGAGNAWLYVEPDGDVLPTQGPAGNVLGNMLNDPWESIWTHARAA